MISKRRSKNNLILAVLILLVATISGLFFLVIVSDFGEDEYRIRNIKVEQNGFKLNVSWDPVEEANGYSVLVYEGIGVPADISSDEPQITVDNIEIDTKYTIVVSALDLDGTINGSKEKKIKTKKLEQKLQVNTKELAGFKGDTLTLSGSAQGKVKYISGNSKIVDVAENGTVSLNKEGVTHITVHAEETDIYEATNVKVDVRVCPDTLDAPELKMKSQTSKDVSFFWSKNKYATEYHLMWMNPATQKYIKVKTLSAETHEATIHRTQGEYSVKAVATVGDRTVASEVSHPVSVKPSALEADTYSKAHNLAQFSKSDLDTIALIHGTGNTRVPQSMSYNGIEYIISYVNHSGTVGKFVAYNEEGLKTREKSETGMGHANGATLNRNTGLIYVAKTHKKHYTADSYSYKAANLSGIGAFKLPKVTSGIAYDPTNDKYYLSKGNVIYVADSNLKVEKSIFKRARYNHAQDIGGYNGVVYVCTWVNGKTSYIDMYRVEDGAYLGSYYIPLGEIESCLVDDAGYLIILMNIKGTNDAYIYKTKERVPF